jgi:putative phage-type endonuclease
MAKKIVNVASISREEWLAWRRTGIGGSDAAAVIGLNPFRSRIEVYADKMGMMPEKEDTESMRLGRDLEDYVAQRFCEATGKKVRRNNFMWCHDEHRCMIADVDREVIGENAGLECKTTQAWGGKVIMKGEIPLTYYVQCMHYMAVMGYDRVYLAVLIFGKGFFHFTIERDEDEIAALVAAETAFWRDHVEAGISPDPDGSQSAEQAVDAIWGNRAQEDELLMFDFSDDMRELCDLAAAEKEIKRRKDAIKQRLQAALGEHMVGSSDRYVITWRPQERSSIDSRRLYRERPDIYREYLTTSSTRIFKIKEIENDDSY